MKIDILTEMEKYRLCRYLYKFGMSPMSDVDYDALESKIKVDSIGLDNLTDFFGGNINGNPFEQSYDDDTVRPDDIINKALTPEEIQYLETLENSGTEAEISLDAYVSKSMQSYRTLRECKPWIDRFKGVSLCISPKIDGVNTTTEFVSGKMVTSRTRGRKGNSISLYDKMKINMGEYINCDDRFIVAAEAVISKNDLDNYNAMFPDSDKSFVTCRGSAFSILRRDDIPEKCIEFVKTFVFRTNTGNTLSEGLSIAESLGFNVVPHEVYTFKYNTYEEYEKELSNLIWKYKTIMDNRGIPTDGLVLQVDDNAYFTNTVTTTAYDGGNLAVKALAWEPGVYISRVSNIVMSAMGTVQYNCKAQVEPVYTEEGKCMQMVNLYNINNMIENDVHVGDYIEFEYVNETTINFRKKVNYVSNNQ